jgi:hypothetical protein
MVTFSQSGAGGKRFNAKHPFRLRVTAELVMGLQVAMMSQLLCRVRAKNIRHMTNTRIFRVPVFFLALSLNSHDNSSD